ncbi:hypothetical protein QQ045_017876 [Rhodiola kirilowii]
MKITVPSTIFGAVIYNIPIKRFDPLTNTTASFSSRFSLSVSSLNPTFFNDDDLAFFLSDDNRTVRSPGLSLDLVISSSDLRVVVVEFDTRLDSAGVNHPSDNHVCHNLVLPILLDKHSFEEYWEYHHCLDRLQS